MGRIVLAEPTLVLMAPKERADAVRLLAALMLAARPSGDGKAQSSSQPAAEALPIAEEAIGKIPHDKEAGEAA